MPRIPQEVIELAQVHRRQLQTLDRRARDAVTRRLKAAAERVAKRIQSKPESFRAQQSRVIQLLADLAEAETTKEMEQVLATLWRSGSKLAPAQTADELNAWLEHYGHEARPINLQALAELDDEILIERIPSSLENWGPSVAESVRDTLADAVAERAFADEMVDRVQSAISDQRWKADRIVRTELSEAYNRSHHQTLQYARDPDGLDLGDDIKKSAIAALDARMDDDSIPVHGQVREVDEKFVDGDGRRYMHPPGRPNDREKEIPWLEEAGANKLAEQRPELLGNSSPAGGRRRRGGRSGDSNEPETTDQVRSVDSNIWPYDARRADQAAQKPEPLEDPNEWGTHRGVVSGRPFDYDNISLPLEKQSLKGMRVTHDGIDEVERHLARFGSDEPNERMLERLRAIADGDLEMSEFDIRFYAHELREFDRYKAAGYETGLPEDDEEKERLWDREHTATLEEFGVHERETPLYHPDAFES